MPNASPGSTVKDTSSRTLSRPNRVATPATSSRGPLTRAHERLGAACGRDLRCQGVADDDQVERVGAAGRGPPLAADQGVFATLGTGPKVQSRSPTMVDVFSVAR